ncbi:MAG: hypothetical protein E4H11_02995 [Myxococcales bacterium]|nr:MAG: hypothetical protein E4H11_02995 [Myxococcales bacterium]
MRRHRRAAGAARAGGRRPRAPGARSGPRSPQPGPKPRRARRRRERRCAPIRGPGAVDATAGNSGREHSREPKNLDASIVYTRARSSPGAVAPRADGRTL